MAIYFVILVVKRIKPVNLVLILHDSIEINVICDLQSKVP